MTLPKKGSRPLRVNGIHFRWKVSSRGRLTKLVVEAAELKGQRLCATFPFGDYYLDRENLWWPYVTIYPRHVQQLIKVALEQGWNPELPGLPPFELQNPEEWTHGSGEY